MLGPVRRSAALVFLLSATSVACGASYQSVYEGDVRFEHCYRLDAEATATHEAKLSCWQTWTKNHTPGQTRDRVEYALSRERALLAGDTRPAGPSFLLTADAEPRTRPADSSGPSVACPLPSTPFESPPTTLPPKPAPSAAVSSSENKALTSSQLCVQDCGNGFTTCATKCKKPGCVNKCGELAKSCIADCLLASVETPAALPSKAGAHAEHAPAWVSCG